MKFVICDDTAEACKKIKKEDLNVLTLILADFKHDDEQDW